MLDLRAYGFFPPRPPRRWQPYAILGATVGALLVTLTAPATAASWIGATVLLLLAAILVVVRRGRAEPVQPRTDGAQPDDERFRSAFESAAVGMALVTTEGRWLVANPALCALLGYSREELLARTLDALAHPDDTGVLEAAVQDVLIGQSPTRQMEVRCRHRLGHDVWAMLSVARVPDPLSGSTVLSLQLHDITERKRAEQRLHHDALHDGLTGLPNRALFVDHLKMALVRSKRNPKRQFAVLFLGLDRFKMINDSLGHSVGDQLLVGTARRLQACLRPTDTVARLGGDEFAVLLEDMADGKEAVHVVERIERELSVPFMLAGHEVFTTISTGIAPGSIGYDRGDEVLRAADTAMYRAKSLGKARHETFDLTMRARAMSLLQLETDLRHAVDRGEFVLHYQPIVSIPSGRIDGFEALVRWKHPDGGFVSPMEFIPVAEESGLIQPIGRWVLGEACRQLRRWQDRHAGAASMVVTVNISGKQFAQSDLVEQVHGALGAASLAPGLLKLEITESAVMESVETAITMLKTLRDSGVESSIDDFGTGYSSLSYLHRFPASTLKIDRSFVSRIGEQSENTEIVRTILTLANSLGMDVVAEGVETPAQLAQLTALGCRRAQGYLYSKPLSPEDAEVLLSRGEPLRAPDAPAQPVPVAVESGAY